MISSAFSPATASMNLMDGTCEGRLVEAVVARASVAVSPMSPASMPAHLTALERAVEGAGRWRPRRSLAQPDAELTAQHLDDVLGGQRIAAGQ